MDLDSARIKQLRQEKAWSQADLAFASSLSRSFVSQVESKQRGISPFNANKIAVALGIPLAEISPGRKVFCDNCKALVIS